MRTRLTQLVVCAAIALFAVPATAMADQRPFQLQLGAVFSHMRFDDPTLDSSWRGNIVFGADFGVPLFPKDSKVQLRGEVLLVPRGGNVNNGLFLTKVKMLYIDTAGLVDVELKESFHLLAGTSIGFRVGSTASVDGFVADISGVFRPVDVGLTLGADVVLVPKRIRMQVLYTHGFMNILSDSAKTAFYFNSTLPAKNQTLLIMIAPGFWK